MRHVSAAACRKICFRLGRFAARGAFAFSKIALSCTIILPIRWTEMLLKLMLKKTPLWKIFLIKLKVIYWKVLKLANMGQQRALKPGFPWYMVVQIILKRLKRTGILLFNSYRMGADPWWMSISKPKRLRCLNG